MLSLAFLIDHALLGGHEQFLRDIEESTYMHSAFLVAFAIPVIIYRRTTPTCFKVTLRQPIHGRVDTMPNTTVETQTAQ